MINFYVLSLIYYSAINYKIAIKTPMIFGVGLIVYFLILLIYINIISLMKVKSREMFFIKIGLYTFGFIVADFISPYILRLVNL